MDTHRYAFAVLVFLVLVVPSFATNVTIVSPSNNTNISDTTPEIAFRINSTYETNFNYTIYVDNGAGFSKIDGDDNQTAGPDSKTPEYMAYTAALAVMAILAILVIYSFAKERKRSRKTHHPEKHHHEEKEVHHEAKESQLHVQKIHVAQHHAGPARKFVGKIQPSGKSPRFCCETSKNEYAICDSFENLAEYVAKTLGHDFSEKITFDRPGHDTSRAKFIELDEVEKHYFCHFVNIYLEKH